MPPSFCRVCWEPPLQAQGLLSILGEPPAQGFQGVQLADGPLGRLPQLLGGLALLGPRPVPVHMLLRGSLCMRRVTSPGFTELSLTPPEFRAFIADAPLLRFGMSHSVQLRGTYISPLIESQ